jgi:hypothetical protein
MPNRSAGWHHFDDVETIDPTRLFAKLRANLDCLYPSFDSIRHTLREFHHYLG